MNTEINCQSCKYYKDGYCENLELKPCYPQKGCDYFDEVDDKTQLYKDKVLVVKYPYVLKKDALKKKHDELLAQINSGCVILDGSAEIMLVSKDNIVMTDEKKDRIPLYYL